MDNRIICMFGSCHPWTPHSQISNLHMYIKLKNHTPDSVQVMLMDTFIPIPALTGVIRVGVVKFIFKNELMLAACGQDTSQ